MNLSQSDIVFLGLAERVSQVADAGTILLKLDILGLKNHLLTNFFPRTLAGVYFCLAIRGHPPTEGIVIRILSDSNELGSIMLSLSEPLEAAPVEDRMPFGQAFGKGWMMIPVLIPTTQTTIILPSSGNYRLIITATDGGDLEIGEFACYSVEPPPFTPERIAAIRSDPYAAKAIRLDLGCQKCSTKLGAYAGLEHMPSLEEQGYTWFSDLPDQFECSCNATKFDLRSMKKGLDGALGMNIAPSNTMEMIPLYNSNALLDICRRFSAILEKNPKEEVIQIFMAENPILLHQFPSTRIFPKPRILNFVADFAILTPHMELILIEIEKANTRLLKKDGGEAAELTHAFDQVRDWLHVVAEHRLAVLATLDIPSMQVSKIKGVVIAGRNKGYNPEHLRRLKGGANRIDVALFTFDDLASSLASLADKVGRV
jgi:hypothetical protein